MRINIKTATHHEAHNTTVTLNGEDVTADCFEADDTEGWVKVFKNDNKGYRCLTEDRQGLENETLFGAVVISCPPEPE